MRSVTYSMAMSLDGYVVGPDGSFDWTVPDEEPKVVFSTTLTEVQGNARLASGSLAEEVERL
jgi:hypothetical protein